jgi:hypothetical protein
MNKIYSVLLLVCAALLLDACAVFPKTADTASSNVRIIDNAPISNQSLLEYAGSFVELSADAQKKELVQVNQAIAQNKNDLKNRMKAAMIYALPNSRMRDTAKAQNLLDDLLREKTLDNERKILATLLRDYLIETNKLSQKARDEQKRADGSQQKLDALQQKNDTLQQMLDDLKNIEKTMVDRDQGIKK